MLFYRFISENLSTYVTDGERAAGDIDFDYAAMPDEEAEAAFEQQFGKDCGNWASAFFSLFRGENPLDAEKRAELSPAEFAEYLKNSYSRMQLLGMQTFMRNEEFNEVGNRILSDLLQNSDEKEK